MIGTDSRYASATRTSRKTRDGREFQLVVPPILPHPDEHAMAMLHRVSDSDRPDTLAARAYGQATAWWLLAEANTVAHPDQLTATPGEELVVPAPGGVALLPRRGA